MSLAFQKASAAVVIVLIPLVTIFAFATRAQESGAALFKAKCAACHGSDGKGETAIGKANKVRDLGSADVQKQSDDELAAIITTGKGKMPAYKTLTAEQVKGLVAYIRALAKK